MHRRQVLAGMGSLPSLAFAGCIGQDDDGNEAFDTEGFDDEPLDDDPETLLLSASTVETVLDEGWEDDTGIEDPPLGFRGADVVRTIHYVEAETFPMNTDRIQAGVWVFETVEEARDGFESHPYEFGQGLEEKAVGSDSLAGVIEMQTDRPRSEERGFVLFRDANAMAAVSFRDEEYTEAELTQQTLELAVANHEHWRLSE